MNAGRPAFHFTARSGWINDPHGVTARGGGYDVFFQSVPGGVEWAPGCEWGRARGPTLLDLTEMPAVLTPGEGDDGIWTGCLVEHDGVARIFYTSVDSRGLDVGSIRIARPRDGSWDTWTKGATVVRMPTGLTAFRDPIVVRDGAGWRMIAGGRLPEGVGALVGWTSDDLETWRPSGSMLSGRDSAPGGLATGSLWECPQLVRVDGRWVVLVAVWDEGELQDVIAAVGDFDADRLVIGPWSLLTAGRVHYAPTVFLDTSGRPCALFWLRGVEDRRAGWAGAHSVPHLLSIDGERVVCTPHPDLLTHRGRPVSDGALPGWAADVEWDAEPGADVTVRDGEAVRLTLAATEDSVIVRGAGPEVRMVRDGRPVRLVVDGPVAEIVSDSGLIGSVMLSGPDPRRVTGTGELTVHPLIR